MSTVHSHKSLAFYLLSGFFYEGFFEFVTLYMVLYLEMASPLISESAETYSRLVSLTTYLLIISKLLGGLGYLLFGYLFIHKAFQKGRVKSLLSFGAGGALLSFLLLFFVAPLAKGNGYVVLFLLFYTMLVFFFSAADIAYWTYLSSLGAQEHRRSLYSSILNGITILGAYTVASLSPSIVAGNARRNMTILGLVLAFGFLLFLGFFVLSLKEKPYLPLPEKDSLNPIRETIHVLFSAKEVFFALFSFLLLFLAQDLFVGNSANYFYYEFGYGTLKDQGFQNGLSGGAVNFYFGIAFGIGNALSAFLYTPILKIRKMNKKRIEIISAVCLVFLYLFYYAYSGYQGREILLLLTAFFVAFFHGLIYDALFVNCFDVSEYLFFKEGKERSALIQSYRASSALVANALQTGIMELFLFCSGYDKTREAVAFLEAKNESQGGMENFVRACDQAIEGTAKAYSSRVYLISLSLLPLLFTLLAVIFTLTEVSVNDEKTYDRYCQENTKRKEKEVNHG